MGFWSFSWKTLKDRGRYFHSRQGWCQTSWTWGWQSCIAATICASRAAPAGGGPSGSAGPTGHGGPGGGSGGASPPPGLPPLPLGGTGVAISNTQCSSRLNLTLLVDTWSIDTQLSTACASIRVACVLLQAYGLQVTMVTCYSDLG